MSQEKTTSILDRLKKLQPNGYKKSTINTPNDRKHFKKQDRGMDLNNIGKNSTKMVSDRDKKNNTEKGKIKTKLGRGGTAHVSNDKFNKMYGAGKRTLSGDEGTLEGGVKATKTGNGWRLRKEGVDMPSLNSVMEEIQNTLKEQHDELDS